MLRFGVICMLMALGQLCAEITIDQWRNLEQYLSSLSENDYPQSSLLRGKWTFKHMKLIGADGEAPVFETLYLNGNPEDKKNCIVLYATFNDPYPQHVYSFIENLKEIGFDGHVLYRIGGYPDVEGQSLQYIDVPYGFKFCALREAAAFGYQNIFWADATLCPVKPLEPLFDILERDGYFILGYHRTLQADIDNDDLDVSLLPSLGITYQTSSTVRHVSTTFFGINTKSNIGQQLLDNIYGRLEEKRSFFSYFPEEIPLSIACANMHLKPHGHFFEFLQYDWREYELNDSHYFLWSSARPAWAADGWLIESE